MQYARQCVPSHEKCKGTGINEFFIVIIFRNYSVGIFRLGSFSKLATNLDKDNA